MPGWAHAPRRSGGRSGGEAVEDRAAELHIGLVAQVPQPVVIKHGMENVPVKAIYNWDPGAHFGIYKPERFWLSR